MPRLTYILAAVDSRLDLLGAVEDAIQQALSGEYLVKGYSSPEVFIASISEYPLHVPLLIIADREAHTPSVAEGVFVRANRIVPRARGILFTARDILWKDWEPVLFRSILCDIVDRTRPDALGVLAKTALRHLNAFKESLEFLLITDFADRMKTTPCFDVSAMYPDDGALSPQQMLIEMARGTEQGRGYLRNMVRARRRRQASGRAPSTIE